MFDLELGTYVKDKVTGFEGIINGRVLWDTGNVQYSVKSRVKDDGSVGSGLWIDPDYFQITKEKSMESNHGQPNFIFSNGEKVQSLKTGYKGHINGCIQWLNGCLEYNVTSEKLEKGKVVLEWFNENELKTLSKTLDLEKRPTGGPESISDRY